MVARTEHRIVDGVELKHCSKCGEWKELGEFSKSKIKWDGLCCWCKKCVRYKDNPLSPGVNGRIEHRFVNEVELKRCGKCKEWKELGEFGKDHRRWDELTGLCKKCYSECRARRYKENPLRFKNQTMKSVYGISMKDYDELLLKQGGKCAICKEAPSGRSLAVDHNHSTGEIRGLLCIHCNTGMGNLGDSIESLQRAIAYLKGEL